MNQAGGASSAALGSGGSPRSTANRDLVIILLTVCALFLISATYGIYHRIHDPLQDAPGDVADEIFIVLLILPILFLFYARRRRAEFDREWGEGVRKSDRITFSLRPAWFTVREVDTGIVSNT